MGKSLLEQLPVIVADGKREAERIMERLESSYRLNLQTRELVIPSKDTNWQSLFRKIEKGEQDLTPATMSRLVYGDNLLAMAALLAGDDENPSLRGKVDLIYIDPPFDSKADYRTLIRLPDTNLEQKPTAIEQFAYSDTLQDGSASYLKMINVSSFQLQHLDTWQSLLNCLLPKLRSMTRRVQQSIYQDDLAYCHALPYELDHKPRWHLHQKVRP